jgi:hypothetical protein
MGSTRRCIGGLTVDGESVRLLDASGNNPGTESSYQVGQIWDLIFTRPATLQPPHVEDVLVQRASFIGVQPDLGRHLLTRVRPWRGGIDQLFDGLVQFTWQNNGYISERVGVPASSTGFWVPDRKLVLRSDGKHYDYNGGAGDRGLSYVGESTPAADLPPGSLVRVSLARWWAPENASPGTEQRCYLQLSGWY